MPQAPQFLTLKDAWRLLSERSVTRPPSYVTLKRLSAAGELRRARQASGLYDWGILLALLRERYPDLLLKPTRRVAKIEDDPAGGDDDVPAWALQMMRRQAEIEQYLIKLVAALDTLEGVRRQLLLRADGEQTQLRARLEEAQDALNRARRDSTVVDMQRVLTLLQRIHQAIESPARSS